MKREELEIYSRLTNHAIIRPPGRRFPGSVIQGDSLSVLTRHALAVAHRVESLGIEDEELRDSVHELQELLFDRLMHYQTVLREHGIELPYHPEMSGAQRVQLIPDEEE